MIEFISYVIEGHKTFIIGKKINYLFLFWKIKIMK